MYDQEKQEKPHRGQSLCEPQIFAKEKQSHRSETALCIEGGIKTVPLIPIGLLNPAWVTNLNVALSEVALCCILEGNYSCDVVLVRHIRVGANLCFALVCSIKVEDIAINIECGIRTFTTTIQALYNLIALTAVNKDILLHHKFKPLLTILTMLEEIGIISQIIKSTIQKVKSLNT